MIKRLKRHIWNRDSISLGRGAGCRYALLVLGLLMSPVTGMAQAASRPLHLTVRTNLVYDMMLMPSGGLEADLGRKLSVAASATYGWSKGCPWHENIRVATADVAVRYWAVKDADEVMWRGFYAGPYAALYRYDFLFGGKGQEAETNWGAGVCLGYSIPVDTDISFDFAIGLGYVGGKYKEYEVVDDSYHHNVWTADKIRHYFGPTRAEVALVWHLWKGAKSKKVKR